MTQVWALFYTVLGTEVRDRGNVELIRRIIIKDVGASVVNPIPGNEYPSEPGFDFDRGAGVVRVTGSNQSKQTYYKHWYIRYDTKADIYHAKRAIDTWYVNTARELRLPMGWSTDEVWAAANQETWQQTPQQYDGVPVVVDTVATLAPRATDLVPAPSVQAKKKRWYRGRVIEYSNDQEFEAQRERYDLADNSFGPFMRQDL